MVGVSHNGAWLAGKVLHGLTRAPPTVGTGAETLKLDVCCVFPPGVDQAGAAACATAIEPSTHATAQSRAAVRCIVPREAKAVNLTSVGLPFSFVQRNRIKCSTLTRNLRCDAVCFEGTAYSARVLSFSWRMWEETRGRKGCDKLWAAGRHRKCPLP